MPLQLAGRAGVHPYFIWHKLVLPGGATCMYLELNMNCLIVFSNNRDEQ